MKTPQELTKERGKRGIDARVWTEEFNQMLVKKGIQPIDPGLMIGWFANAIMAGFDKGKEESK